MPNDSAGLPSGGPSVPFHGIMGRAILLVPLFLAVWWFLLKGAALWLLRILGYVALGLLVAPARYEPLQVNPATGEWVFNVAVNALSKDARTGQPQRIESLEFAVSADSVAFFTSGWFSYLALGLSAARFSRIRVKTLLWGEALQTGVSILCFTLYVYINGYGDAINTPNNHDPALWLIQYVYHIIYLVIPFAGPFMVALLVHPEWRDYFTGRTSEGSVPKPEFLRPDRRSKRAVRRSKLSRAQ